MHDDWKLVTAPPTPADNWKPVAAPGPVDDWHKVGEHPHGDVHAAINAAAKRFGVDPRLVHAEYESEGGDKAVKPFGLLAGTKGYSGTGYTGRDDSFSEYANVNAAYWASDIREMKAKGIPITDESLVKYHESRYTPVGAANDPTGLNANKISNMLRLMGTKHDTSEADFRNRSWGQFFDPHKITSAPAAKPTAPASAQHATQAGIGDIGAAAHNLRGARLAVNRAWVGGKEQADWVRRNPVEALSNAMGSLERPTAAIAGDLLNGKWADPKGMLHHAQLAVMKPQDNQKIVDALEIAIAHDLGIAQHNPMLAQQNPSKWHGPAKFVADLVTESVVDPMTYIPVADFLTIGHRAVKLLAAATHSGDAAKAAISAMGPLAKTPAGGKLLSKLNDFRQASGSLVQKGRKAVDSALAKRPELDAFMPQDGKLARMAIEGVANYTHSTALADNAKLLSRYSTELKSLKYGDKVPPEVQRHLVMEAWKYGSHADRVEAENILHGMNMPPTQAELKQFPNAKGYFNYEGDLQANYVSKILPKGKSAAATLSPEGQASFEFVKALGKKVQIPFTKPVTAAASPALAKYTMHDLISNRLALGAAVLRRQQVAHDSANLYRQYGPQILHGDPGVEDHLLPDWFAKNVPDHAGIFKGPFQSLRQVSDMFKMGILGNPIPHGLINVGTITLFRSNPYVLGRGLWYGLKGVPGHVDERLEAIGGKTSYWRDPSSVPLIPGTQGAFTKSQELLDRLETGYRASYLQYLDKRVGTLPKSDPQYVLHEFLKGQKVNHDIGDYANPTQLVSFFKTVGGLYDTFRLDVVPRAGTHALIHKPLGQTLNLAARTQDEFSQDFMPKGEHLNLFGPLDDFSKLVSGALTPLHPLEGGTIDYMTSTATLGPALGSIADRKQKEGSGYVPSWEQDLAWMANYLVPGVGSMSRMIPNPQDRAPAWIKFWMEAVAGGWASSEPSSRTAKHRHKQYDRAANRLLGE